MYFRILRTVLTISTIHLYSFKNLSKYRFNKTLRFVRKILLEKQNVIFLPFLYLQGQCAYSDQVVRKGCSASEVFKFDCPAVKDSRHEHPRYPDPNGKF